MLARFFASRPVFAWVISIVIILAGVASIMVLPIAQYPDVAPPSVNISASYFGASADTVENSVTQVLEQQLTGIDGLLYLRQRVGFHFYLQPGIGCPRPQNRCGDGVWLCFAKGCEVIVFD